MAHTRTFSTSFLFHRRNGSSAFFMRKFTSTDVLPLNGIRILDLTRIVAGPYCTMLLGDLGADVIKIERPGTGDEARNWGPPFVGNESCYFLPLNRNKRSICIDIKHPSGRELIYKLATSSDVLVENYVPGKLDALKLGYDHLRKIAPQLVYCSITGYGSEGPYSKKPGYDVIAASIGGLLHITGSEGENSEPIKVGVAVTDIATGLYAHGAIMAALMLREKTGKGQKIHCNLLSTQLASLINIGSNYLNAKKEGKRWGTAHESIVPYQTFRTKDGFYTIGTGSDTQFHDFCRLIERPDLIEKPNYKTNNDRVQNRTQLIEIISKELRKKSNDEWKLVFAEAKFPNGPVNSLRDAFDDPHVKFSGIVKEVKHPTAGNIKLVGPAVKYSQFNDDVRMPPPVLGQHTEEILKEILNLSLSEVDKLKTEKVVQ